MFRFLRWPRKATLPAAGGKSTRRRIDLGDNDPRYPIYVIGDIHGCYQELMAAEARILADMERHEVPGLLVLLGDYIDRGPQSAAVLEHLSSPAPHGIRRLALCGNHEQMFLDFLTSSRPNLRWLDVGGRNTLQSYGINVHEYVRNGRVTKEFREILEHRVPVRHRLFIENLPVLLRVGSYLFVHAGIRPGVEIANQDENDLLWIREPFLTNGPQLPLLVFHGHTPVETPDFGTSRIGLDTGAYATGNLTVLKLEHRKYRFI